MTSALAASQAIYIDDDAPAGGNGTSWATAYTHLQDALAPLKARSSDSLVEVRMAQGVYKPDRSEMSPEGNGDRDAAFELSRGVQLMGGYAGIGATDPNLRDFVAYSTVLSGDLAGDDANVPQDEPTRADNSHHVVTILGRAGLDGVTIAGGHASASGDSDSASDAGGGLQILQADATIRHCTFRDNRATWGGAIYSANSQHVELTNCLMVGNIAFVAGAVLYNQNGPAILRNCTAAGNMAPEARFLSDSTPRPGRGLLPPSIRVDSCILADGGNEVTNGYAALTIQYTDMGGGQSAISDPKRAMTWGPGNMDADPCFADAGRWDVNSTPEDANDDFFVPGDYHLKSRAGRWDSATQAWVQDLVTSPCIDAGNPVTPFDREPLPNGSRVNMGVYGGTAEASKSDTTWQLVTTQGPLPAEGLGVILPHEHIFTDLRGPTVAGYGQANPADVLRVMKPWLVAARSKGAGVLIECTSIGVGRNVPIVDQVARESGLPVVVPTGVYGRDNFAPPEHRNMTEDELTALFIREIREGIEGTGIKAGFIKIATGSSTMTPMEEKFLRAACRAASATGAAVASHTPLSSNASRQAAILQSIDPAVRLIWVHAQSENNRDMQRQLAGRGVFIEFDSLGANPGQDPTVITAIKDLLAAGCGDHILLSHDAGYYQPGSANGGSQRSFTYLIETFIPRLRDAGLDDATIRMITEINPVRAFGFKTSE